MELFAQEILDSMDGVAYVVDGDGAIVAYGRPNWDAFANENSCPALAEPSHVLEKKLVDFISGEEVRALVTGLMNDVLGGKSKSIVFPCHCDSPTLEREMRMSVSAIGETNRLLFHSVALSVRMRPTLDLYDFRMQQDYLADETIPILDMCSWCQKILFPVGSPRDEGRWVQAEEYYRLGGTANVRISHGICPLCHELMRQ